MDEVLSKSRRVLFTAIIIACVFTILMELYRLGYAVYTWTDDFSYLFGRDNFGYVLYSSSALKTLSWIFSYAGLAAVFAFYKAPRPKASFILLFAALFLPKIVSEILSLIIWNTMHIENYALAFNIIDTALTICCMALFWVMIIILYRKSGKDEKPIIIAYMVKRALSNITSIMISFTAASFVGIASAYASRAMVIVLGIMTIVYLKKKLQGNMPFAGTLQWIRRECTNRPPEC